MATVEYLAKKYGYGVSTIPCWINKKLLPARKIRGKFHIDESKFVDLIHSDKVRAPIGYTKRNRALETYKQHTRTEHEIIADQHIVTDDPSFFAKPLEATNKEKAIIALDDYLTECYDTHELTPHDYITVKKALKILKGE